MEKYPNVALINISRIGLVRNPSKTNSWIIDTDKQSKDLYDTFNQYIMHLIRCGKTTFYIEDVICNGREPPEEVDTSSSAASAAGSGKVASATGIEGSSSAASAAGSGSATGIEGSSKVAPAPPPPPTKKPEGGGGSLGGARKTRRRRSTRSRGSRRYRRRS